MSDLKRITDARLLLLVLLLAAAALIWLVPDNLNYSLRGITLASIFGASVGFSEIISRYRDEPLRAAFSPFGLIYILLNGLLATFAFLIICRYPDKFGFSEPVPALLGAIAAGFGSCAVMRTRLVVLKSSDNKDIPVGPDLVIKTLLQMVDQYVDRTRAAARQIIVVQNFHRLRALGSFPEAADYLQTSLFAFQNMEEDKRNQLAKILEDYARRTVPEDFKYLALGFVFLSLVGESHFAEVLQNAIQRKDASRNVAGVGTTQPTGSPTDAAKPKSGNP